MQPRSPVVIIDYSRYKFIRFLLTEAQDGETEEARSYALTKAIMYLVNDDDWISEEA